MTTRKLLAIATLLAAPAATTALACQASRISAQIEVRRAPTPTSPQWEYFLGVSGGWSAVFDTAGAVALYASAVGPEGALAGALAGAA